MWMWSALVIGLVGSLHCIGMCGPIAAALPIDNRGKTSALLGRLIYNFGRIISYAILGAIFGLIGQTIYLAGYQQALSIAMGIAILIAVLMPAKYSQSLLSLAGVQKVYGLLSKLWGKLFRSARKPALLGIGVLNGFLPCGFVYVGIAGAIATANVLDSVAYMALFGLGTVPVMLTLSLAGNFVGAALRQRIHRLVPALAVVVACLFIFRGLGLGIPYLSPKFAPAANISETGSCCHSK